MQNVNDAASNLPFFSRRAVRSNLQVRRQSKYRERFGRKEGNVLCPPRFVDGSTEICFGSDDGDQFGAKLRFSEEHILYIARQSFTLRRARSANRPLLFPLTPE